jgi:hypothetical protein
MKTQKTILEIIRFEIKRGTATRYQIYKATGVEQSTLCRIMQGQDLTTEKADKILRFLGYSIVKGKNDGKHIG